MKFSTVLVSVLPLLIASVSALQKTEIRWCRMGGSKWHKGASMVNVFDDEEYMCNTKYVITDFEQDKSFPIQMFGTNCIFHTSISYENVRDGEVFGYVNCPGMKWIQAVKDSKSYWDVCGLSTWGCTNLAKMEWDGCLSCGEQLCFADSECPGGCCDKSYDFCSTPENSACKNS